MAAARSFGLGKWMENGRFHHEKLGYSIWELVGGDLTILKNMSSSMERIIYPIYEMENIKNVPNHQPDWNIMAISQP